MSLKVTKMDVWSGEIQDQPGGLAGVLRQLAGANANLEMVVARRQPDRPGTGIVFLAPVKGRKVTAAAAVAGLGPATSVAALRVEGTDRPGLGAKMTSAIADAGINLRGLSAAALGNRFAAYYYSVTNRGNPLCTRTAGILSPGCFNVGNAGKMRLSPFFITQ